MSGKAAHISGIVVRRQQADDPPRSRPPRISRPPRDAVLLRRPARHAARPQGRPQHSLGRPLLRDLLHARAGRRAERNPNYTGSRPHHVDRIELTVGVSQQKAGRRDRGGHHRLRASTASTRADVARIAARYGPASPAARKGGQQYFVNPQLGVDFIVLNTHRPLFRDVRLRRAVNYAIDRRALARIGGVCDARPKRPTDQYLPPGMPGFKNAHIYPFTPDLAAARRLAGGQTRTAILYTCNTSILRPNSPRS